MGECEPSLASDIPEEKMEKLGVLRTSPSRKSSLAPESDIILVSRSYPKFGTGPRSCGQVIDLVRTY